MADYDFVTSEVVERFREQRVTYTLELQGQLIQVENVPARVDVETGEQLFAPETVEQLQQLLLSPDHAPKGFIQVPVYEFALSGE